MLKKILYFYLMQGNIAYVRFLQKEKRRAEEYVDKLNTKRNFALSNESYNGSLAFRKEWFLYEDEYSYNFCGLE